MTQVLQELLETEEGAVEKKSLWEMQKTCRDGADVTWRGSSFQTREGEGAAATGKAWSPTNDKLCTENHSVIR